MTVMSHTSTLAPCQHNSVIHHQCHW